jgi:colanic acid/amylovoran biosynthesis glycosyltransferase
MTSADMTVAHSVYQWLLPNENWMLRQIEYQRKYENIVLATYLTPDHPSVKHLFVTRDAGLPLWLACKVFEKISGRDVLRDRVLSQYGDVLLHSHFGEIGWADTHLKNKRKHITRFYGYDIDRAPNTRPVWKERYKALFDKCDAFLVEGPFMRQSLIKRGCPGEKIFVHCLGTDVNQIPYKSRSFGNRLKILMASRFTEKKGLTYALEGIGKAYHDLGCHEISVTIIGSSDGSAKGERYKDDMLETIRKNRIEGIVTMPGLKSFSDLIDIAISHDVFLHPSVTASDGDSEGGYPVVLLDMMASGMPVISTRHCDIPEIVPDARYGVLCEERNSTDIAQALQHIVSGKITFDSKFISDGIREEYNWEKRGEELVRIYERVMQ